MQVIGLGWKQFASQKGVRRSVDELAMHLKMIIREEKKLMPPTDPAIEIPKNAELLYTQDNNTATIGKQ